MIMKENETVSWSVFIGDIEWCATNRSNDGICIIEDTPIRFYISIIKTYRMVLVVPKRPIDVLLFFMDLNLC